MEASDSIQSNDDSQLLANEAALLFRSGSYNHCLLKLNQLLQKEEDKPKILHNKAVTEYLRDGCVNPQRLYDVLLQVKGKIEELEEEIVESCSMPKESNPGSASLVQTDPLGSVSGLAQVFVTHREERDTSIVRFNTAVVLCQLQKNAAAMSLLESLYRDIEPIDESTAMCVCLLMLDILLASHQPRKAAGVIEFMEKSFCSGILITSSGGSNDAAQSSSLSATSIVAETNSMLSIVSLMPPSPNRDPSLMGMLLNEDGLDDEHLTIGLELESLNPLTAPLLISANVSRERLPSALQKDAKLILHLYRVRLLLLTGNLKAAKREIEFMSNLEKGYDCVTLLMLRAELQYLQENHAKALKLLIYSSQEAGMNYMLLNNLGCVYSHLQKPSVAAVFFLRALTDIRSKKCYSSHNKSLAILYNCGLQQLHNGNPGLAFQSFCEVARFYYKRPLLWLRLAECCISALEKGLLDDGEVPIGKGTLKVESIGEGRWRHIILPSGGFCLPKRNGGFIKPPDGGGVEFFSFGKPYKMSLVFARRCLNNAWNLLHRVDCNGENGPDSNGKECSLEEEREERERVSVRECLLANLAFVELSLDCPGKAFWAAELLLKELEHSGSSLKLSGHIYAAEALCMLNKPKEAYHHLLAGMRECASRVGRDWQAEVGESTDGMHYWGAQASLEIRVVSGLSMGLMASKACLYVNLAAVNAMRGMLVGAHHCARKAAALCPTSPLPVLSVAFMDLLRGRTKDAISTLKHCRHLCYTN